MPDAHTHSFRTTRWSLVVAAGGTTNPRTRAALSELCRLYWYPVHAFVRRSGHAPDEAQDLTQGFFADLLNRNDLGTADQSRGRFRSWLLGCVKHFLANRHDFETAQKRGGGALLVPLDAEEAEGRYSDEAVDAATPEQLYLRRWAMQLISRVLGGFREEKVRAGTLERFELLQPYLVNEGEANYRALGEALGTSENAVKTAIHSLRERFRDRLRTEIAGTVTSVDGIDEEIRQLLTALG